MFSIQSCALILITLDIILPDIHRKSHETLRFNQRDPLGFD